MQYAKKAGCYHTLFYQKAAGTVLFGLASVPGGTNVGKKIDDKESLRWYTKVKENLENMSKL